MEEELNREMEEYNRELENRINENEEAKNSGRISREEYLKIKKLYYILAKKLHPDINPKTEEIPELKALWIDVVIFYNSNDLSGMEETQVLIERALERLGLGIMEIEIPDIQEKIDRVSEEIGRIKSKEPYSYKYLLDDPELIQEKKKELESEFKVYEDYENKLDEVIQALLNSGVNLIWTLD